MISVAVEIPGLKELVTDEARDIMRLVTVGTADLMKIKIQEPKSGKEYRRGTKIHIASAPGEAPGNDSSNLLTTVMPKVRDLQGEIFLAEYGLFLEFGTDTIAPRDFIISSLETVLQEL